MIINSVLIALAGAKAANTAKVYLGAKPSKRDSKLGLGHANLFIGLTIFPCPIIVEDNVDLAVLLGEAGLALPNDLHQVFMEMQARLV